MIGRDLVFSLHWCASPWISRSAGSTARQPGLKSDIGILAIGEAEDEVRAGHEPA